MNKNLAFFLIIMLAISVFAVVVMTKVPRRGVVSFSVPETTTEHNEVFILARTAPGIDLSRNHRSMNI